jgi:hypothetical protein
VVVLSGQLGCESVTFRSSRFEAAQAELNRRYDLWRQAAPARYQYRFNRVCPACAAELNKEAIVEVDGTTVTAVTYTDSSGTAPDSSLGSYFTVEGLFGQIQIAINQLADTLRVEYDPTLNYPRVIVGNLNVFIEDDELELYAADLIARQ